MAEQNLERTNAAFQGLQGSLENLLNVLNAKKNALLQQKESYKGNIQAKNAQIEVLQKTIESAVQTIDRNARKIDEVIKQNATSHNSN